MIHIELAVIWYSSLVLAAFSVTCMVTLVVNRFITNKRKLRRQTGQAALTEYLLTTDAEDGEHQTLKSLTQSSVVLALTISEISTIMRGPAFDGILERLKTCNAEMRLINLLDRRSPQQRVVAAEALAYFPTETVRKALWKAYARPGPAHQRIIIAQALVLAGARPELADFFAHLDLTRSEDLADMTALFKTIAMQNPEPVIRRAKIAYDPPEVRAALLRTLGHCGAIEALDLFARDAHDASPVIRAAALDAIGEIGFLPDLSVVSDALKDEASEVRAEAARTIGLLMEQSHIADLITLTSDQDWDVRFRAAKSLTAFGDVGIDALKSIAAHARNDRASATAQLILDEAIEA